MTECASTLTLFVSNIPSLHYYGSTIMSYFTVPNLLLYLHWVKL